MSVVSIRSFMATRKLILASASPRRRELLASLGVPFEVVTADLDETPLENEAPAALVQRLAASKAQVVGRREPEAVIVAADTTVAIREPNGRFRIFEKPMDAVDAHRMLSQLSGRKHSVFTGICVMIPALTFVRTRLTETAVQFDQLTTQAIENYIATGEPMDKAGAYAIQGIGGTFVRSIEGSYSNVVGLPLAELVEELRATGLWADFPQRSKPNES